MAQIIEDVPNGTAIELVGRLIDLADDLKRPAGTSQALEWCDSLEQRGLSESELALLAYFRANAWANRQREKRSDRRAAWAWEQPELERQILNLRKAVNSPGFRRLSSVRRSQILTNLANCMNTVGRFVEALEHWNRALAVNPQFGMALGNLGYGLKQYARVLCDSNHQALFLFFAHQALSEALSQRAEYESAYEDAKRAFSTEIAGIERIVDIALVARRLHHHSLGESEEEQKYRCWSLHNRLFLNPLNDAVIHSVASSDVLTLPTFITSPEEPPTLIGFFNQMKQEFVSARWMLYEGWHANDVHFSDLRVKLYNTLDYPSYSLAIEKVKAAYRIAYSILDKIGFFLNDYMALGIDPTRVYFKSVWYKKKSIHPKLEQSENWLSVVCSGSQKTFLRKHSAALPNWTRRRYTRFEITWNTSTLKFMKCSLLNRLMHRSLGCRGQIA
jgi:tetratricopeptide (TPR) repeat protein